MQKTGVVIKVKAEKEVPNPDFTIVILVFVIEDYFASYLINGLVPVNMF